MGSLSGSTVTMTSGTGTATTTYSQAGNANFNAATTVAETTTAQEANQTITWSNPADIVYGTALSATQLNASVAGTGPAPTGAKTYAPASGTVLNAGAHQTLHVDVAATSNYNVASKDVFINVLQADYPVVVTGYTGVYDAKPHGASGSVPASAGTLNLGAKFTNVPGGTAHWVFTGSANFRSQSGDVSIVITKADATVLVAGYVGVYDGQAHGSGAAVGWEARAGTLTWVRNSPTCRVAALGVDGEQ